ncbi:MAG: hypothetical protein LBI53_05045 [Candidatus Peribacteria bacterium]|jgi:hypothetical protein|nr:hypothetical protein [Candidatus Peribacteria bacterium]
MEYIDGKTLYTLTLETIIKTLIEKVKNTPLREFEEWIEGEMNIFEGSWKQEKKDELKKIKDHLESKDGPKINGKSFNDYKSFSNKEKQVMLTEIKRLEEKVKDEFSKK